MSLPATQIWPSVGCSSLLIGRMKVLLPDPGGADQEDELALLDVEVGLTQSDVRRLVDLGDVVEFDQGNHAGAVEGPIDVTDV